MELRAILCALRAITGDTSHMPQGVCPEALRMRLLHPNS